MQTIRRQTGRATFPRGLPCLPLLLIALCLAAPARAAGPDATLIHLPSFPAAGVVEASSGPVRLEGVAATSPDLECGEGEAAWPCGRMARAALQRFVRRRAVECREPSEGEADRHAFSCSVAGADIGRWLVAQGWARAEGGLYEEEEAEAKDAGLGLWAEARPRLLPASVPSGPIDADLAQAAVVAEVALSSQTMTLFHDGALVGRWAVSTARAGKVTPVGAFRAQWLSRDHRSTLYDGAPMPFSVFFNGDYAVHGTYQTGRLGQPASAGCVRLSPEHARILFELARREGLEKTVVVIRE